MPVITAIINEKRPLPQVGKYRIARMHAKLLPEFNTLDERRSAMIRAYDAPELEINFRDALGDHVGPEARPTGRYVVPGDKIDEFNAAWKEILGEEIEIPGLEPLPLKHLTVSDDADGAIEAYEIVTLGELIAE